MNIILTGFMGTGKTAVGTLIAKRLKYDFIDSDDSIAKDVGLSISEIFINKGEPFFREVESKIISLVSLLDRTVIATGGGVVLKESNMKELSRNGKIVCLKARPETIFKRLKDNKSRPLLQKEDPLAEIKKLLNEREKFYRKCDLAVDTDDMPIEEIADKILRDLKWQQ